MPAWLIGGTRQRRRRYCASGWEETKEGSAVWWRYPNDRNRLDFPIGLISSPRWEQDTERKRRPSNDHRLENKTEKETVSSTRWEQGSGALPFRRSEALPDQRSVPLESGKMPVPRLLKSLSHRFRRICTENENALSAGQFCCAASCSSPAFRRNLRLTRRLKAGLQQKARALGVAWFVNENGMHAKAMQAQLFTAQPWPFPTGLEGTVGGTHRQTFTQTPSATSCKSAIKAKGHHPGYKTNISSAQGCGEGPNPGERRFASRGGQFAPSARCVSFLFDASVSSDRSGIVRREDSMPPICGRSCRSPLQPVGPSMRPRSRPTQWHSLAASLVVGHPLLHPEDKGRPTCRGSRPRSYPNWGRSGPRPKCPD